MQIAQAMQRVICRSADLLARYGGEEFAIILPNTDIEGAICVGKNLQQAIANLHIPHIYSQVKSIVTVSIGIASIIPNPEVRPEELVNRADRELYHAKQQGRDRISAHTFHCV